MIKKFMTIDKPPEGVVVLGRKGSYGTVDAGTVEYALNSTLFIETHSHFSLDGIDELMAFLTAAKEQLNINNEGA